MAFSCSNRRRSSLARWRWRVISLFLRPVCGVCSTLWRATHRCFSICFSCLSSDSSFLTARSLLVFSIRMFHFVLCPAEDCERLVGGLIKTLSAQHERGGPVHGGSFWELPRLSGDTTVGRRGQVLVRVCMIIHVRVAICWHEKKIELWCFYVTWGSLFVWKSQLAGSFSFVSSDGRWQVSYDDGGVVALPNGRSREHHRVRL